MPPTAAELWQLLPWGYLLTITLETPVLLFGLSERHSVDDGLFRRGVVPSAFDAKFVAGVHDHRLLESVDALPVEVPVLDVEGTILFVRVFADHVKARSFSSRVHVKARRVERDGGVVLENAISEWTEKGGDVDLKGVFGGCGPSRNLHLPLEPLGIQKTKDHRFFLNRVSQRHVHGCTIGSGIFFYERVVVHLHDDLAARSDLHTRACRECSAEFARGPTA